MIQGPRKTCMAIVLLHLATKGTACLVDFLSHLLFRPTQVFELHAMSSSCGLFSLDTNALKGLYPGAEQNVATLVPGSSETVQRYFRFCHYSTTESSYVAHHVPLGCGRSSLAI